MKKCKLPPDINSCQFYNQPDEACINPGKCSFQYVEVAKPSNYKREERWFEKYYDQKRKSKHHRIWQAYAPVSEGFDEALQGALKEIEALDELPESFEIRQIDRDRSGRVQIWCMAADGFESKIKAAFGDVEGAVIHYITQYGSKGKR